MVVMSFSLGACDIVLDGTCITLSYHRAKTDFVSFSILGHGLHLKPPKVDLEPFRLQQDLPRRGMHVECLVDRLAVDANLDRLVLAQALDLGPLAERAFDVVFAARVEQ